MYIYFNMATVFPETFCESCFKFLKSLKCLVFLLLLGEKTVGENGMRK